MISGRELAGLTARVKQRIRHKVRLADLTSPRKWRFWTARLVQELQRMRLEQQWELGDGSGPEKNAYDFFLLRNALQPHVKRLLEEATANFKSLPLFSIIMPVYDVPAKWLDAAIESVCAQIYPHWELCIADDASTAIDTLKSLERWQSHPRIRIHHRKQNGGICAASSDAAASAEGDYLVLMDHDDLLAEHALFELARRLQDAPQTDLLYSDEDKIDAAGKRYDPFFKPDWSPTLLLSFNYINHLTCIRHSVFTEVGGFRAGTDGAQDYDLLLRVVQKTQRIAHIDKVLYHWRAVDTSTATSAGVKPIVAQSALKALQTHLTRNNAEIRLYQPSWTAPHGLPVYQLDGPDEGPSVDILIPTKNRKDLLERCVTSIRRQTAYRNYRILIVDNGSDEEDTLAYLETLSDECVRIERIENPPTGFSFSRICNQAVTHSTADYILFLNNDTEVTNARWLSRMMAYVQLEGVGAAGARLLFPDDTIQHGGVLLHLADGIAPSHAFYGLPADLLSPYFLAESARDVSAVTGACLLTPRQLFVELGGFNENDFAVSLNDIDYCLRLKKKGYRCIYVPGAELLHFEAATRPKEDDPAELARFRAKYGNTPDHYYNRNLSAINHFGPVPQCRLDYGSLRGRPLRVLFFTHNLNFEGATKVVIDLARHLVKRDGIDAQIISFQEGPLGGFCRDQGLACSVLNLPGTENILQGWLSARDLSASVDIVAAKITEQSPDLIFTNVVNTFFVVEAAATAKKPCLWLIHESYDRKQLLQYLPPFALDMVQTAFSHANRVLFVSHGTRRLYQNYNRRANFSVIHNSLNPSEFEIRSAGDTSAAQGPVEAPENAKIIVSIGTVCARKDQATIVRAMARLARQRSDFICFLVGGRPGDPYSDRVQNQIEKTGLTGKVRLIAETSDVIRYYQAADIFAFSSLNESYSLTIVEAMAFGLPIVTTACIGISEQVRFGVNALHFDFGDDDKLSEQIAQLLENPALRQHMGRNSRQMFAYMQTHDEMLGRYLEVMEAAWQEGPAR